jgi:hypothetical protein
LLEPFSISVSKVNVPLLFGESCSKEAAVLDDYRYGLLTFSGIAAILYNKCWVSFAL